MCRSTGNGEAFGGRIGCGVRCGSERSDPGFFGEGTCRSESYSFVGQDQNVGPSSRGRLEEELEVQAVPVPTTSEVQRLQALVAQLQSQLVQAAPATLVAPSDSRSKVPVAKRCRREDFVPHCDEEMQEWMQGRQADLPAAIATGLLQEVSRISHLVRTAAQEWQELIDRSTTMPHRCERGEVSRSCCVSRDARYGWRGFRIGEASHPGPPKCVAGDGGTVQTRQLFRRRGNTLSLIRRGTIQSSRTSASFEEICRREERVSQIGRGGGAIVHDRFGQR